MIKQKTGFDASTLKIVDRIYHLKFLFQKISAPVRNVHKRKAMTIIYTDRKIKQRERKFEDGNNNEIFKPKQKFI